MQPEVLSHASPNGLLALTLNRPQALNALNLAMIDTLTERLRAHSMHKPFMPVLLKANGTAFCAGGDIRALAEAVRRRDFAWFSNYLTHEYKLDRMVYNYRNPYVALLNGVWMGGGVGISFGGKFKIVTEKTLFAMPETGIGFLPDVSGYFLPRLPGQLGMYIGLLGIRLKAADTLYAGIATHYVPSARLPQLVAALESGDMSEGAEACRRVIEQFAAAPDGHPSLAENRQLIDWCFGASSVEEIAERLRRQDNAWAKEALRTLEARSPMALKVTFKAFRLGATMTLEAALNMEHQVCLRMAQHPDFFEGVRAIILEKDNKPRWNPTALAAVSDSAVDEFFSRPEWPVIVFDY